MGNEERVLWDVVQEHLEEADFRWECWERALASPLLRAREVADGVEARLAAHLEGLAIAGPAAVDRLLEPALHEGALGEAFAAATALLEMPEGIGRVGAALAEADDDRRPVLARALALSRGPGEGDLLGLLEKGPPAVAAAGLEALARRGADPGPPVLRFCGSDDAALSLPALRAARGSAQPVRAVVERALQLRDPAVRAAAIETGIQLGFRSAFAACRQLVEAVDPEAGLALAVLAIGGDPADLPAIEKALTLDSLRAPAVVALGYAGRIAGIEALLSSMDGDPVIARLAGEAFSAITGIAIEGELLAQEREDPEEVSFEGDDLDAHLAPGAQAELPLPAARAVAARWASARTAFDPAIRYLSGKPFTPECLVLGLASAPMRRRPLLTLELSVRSRGCYRIETRDWVFEQLRAEGHQSLSVRSDTALPFSRFLRD